MSAAAFDRFAADYDTTWTNAPEGRRQRDAVWRNLAGLFQPGEAVLDIGCGTGEDAAWLMRAGVRVSAIDASQEMVALARRRGVEAQVLRIEDLGELEGHKFDGAISNFGPLNCLASLDGFALDLAELIRPGGHVALCMMGRFCLRETLAFAARGQFRKAARRWSGVSRSASLGIRVYYPTVRAISQTMAPAFELQSVVGIGTTISAIADHRLLIFTRR